MCVIIAIPAGEYLEKDLALRNWRINNDGAGFAYHDGQELVTFKSMNFDEFWRKFERARSDNRNTDFLVHMRIATHGSVCLDNVHPYLSTDGKYLLAHNGILKGVPEDKEADRSDTRVFLEDIAPELGEAWYRKPWLNEIVAAWIDWNKFAILDEEGIWLVNEDLGDWYQGMWFSNSYGLPGGVSKTKAQATPKATVTPLQQSWDWDEHDGYGYWLDGNNKVIEGVIKGNFTLESEKQRLSRLRDNEGYFHALDWDEMKTIWYCRGCLGDVNEKGDCACFDLWDKTCEELLGFCECEYEDREIIDVAMIDMDYMEVI